MAQKQTLSKREQAEQFLKRQYDAKMWIEKVTGSEVPNTNLKQGQWEMQKALQNGVILCKVVKKIRPELIPIIQEAPKQSFKSKENINYFISAVEELGVPRYRLFQTTDLYDNVNFYKVLECIEDLALVAHTKGLTEHSLDTVSDGIQWEEKHMQQAEKDLRFVELKPKLSIQKIKNHSGNVRKSMAMALLSKEKQQDLLRVSEIANKVRQPVSLPSQQSTTQLQSPAKNAQQPARNSNATTNSHPPQSPSKVTSVPSKVAVLPTKGVKLPPTKSATSPTSPSSAPAPTSLSSSAPTPTTQATAAPTTPTKHVVPNRPLPAAPNKSTSTPTKAAAPPQQQTKQSTPPSTSTTTTSTPTKAASAPKPRVLSASDHTKVEKGIIALQAHVRGRIARRNFQRRITDNAYRRKVVQEILETEKVYVNNLNTLMKVYYAPLKAAVDAGKPILKQDYLKAIFPDTIGVILNYNTKLLAELEPKVNDWSPHQKIGNIILSFTAFMKVYTQYVKDFPQAHELYDSLKVKDKKFSQFLQECKAQAGGIELDMFLILPIQRIPRYNLLLADLVKHTWSDHIDYEDLRQSLEKMRETADYINERKREADSINKILEIQAMLGGKVENLADPQRRFIREGVLMVLLTKDGVPKGGPKDRTFFLFNDKLLITKPVTRSILGKETLSLIESIDVMKIDIREETDSPTSFSFMKDGAIYYKVVVASKVEKDSWVKDFTKTKAEQEKKNQRNHAIALQRSQNKAEEVKSSFMEQYRSMAANKGRSATLSHNSLERRRKGSVGVGEDRITRDSSREGSFREGSLREGSFREGSFAIDSPSPSVTEVPLRGSKDPDVSSPDEVRKRSGSLSARLKTSFNDLLFKDKSKG